MAANNNRPAGNGIGKRARPTLPLKTFPLAEETPPIQTHTTFTDPSSLPDCTGTLTIPPDQRTYTFTSEDLQDIGEIGRGNFGSVNKMFHKTSQTYMAVKRIRSTVDEKEQHQLLMDLNVVKESSDCEYIIKFYGALFKEGDCWICMELMDASLEKVCKFVYDTISERIPEHILGKVTVATVKALQYLKKTLTIIHRDVKPSNILVDMKGNIKLCDFGISGQLVDSIAKTKDAGCRPYMAPERIDPGMSKGGYDIRSDVWSLGITLHEIATGKFPYPKWNSVFDQLTQVVKGDPPLLHSTPELPFSTDFLSFVNVCLTKSKKERPKYDQLLNDQFIKQSESEEIDVEIYFSDIISKMREMGFLPHSQDIG